MDDLFADIPAAGATPAGPDLFDDIPVKAKPAKSIGGQAADIGRQFTSGVALPFSGALKGAAIGGALAERANPANAQNTSDADGYEAAAKSLEEDIELLPDEDSKAFAREEVARLRALAEQRRTLASTPSATSRTPAKERLPYRIGQSIDDFVSDTVGKVAPEDVGLGGQVAQGLGNFAGMGAATVGATVVGGPVAGAATGAVMGYGMNASQVYEEALATGVDEDTALDAAKWAGLVGMSEVIPVFRALKFAPKGFSTKAMNVLKDAAEEGGQEGVSQVLNNWIAQGYYDPERGFSDGVAESMLVGSIVGGTVGVTVGVMSPSEKAALNTAPPAAAPPAAPADNGIAPDTAAALGASPRSADEIARQVMASKSKPATQPGNAPAEAAAPATEQVAKPTEQVASPAAEAAGDTIETVPEAPATIENQNAALLDPKNKRKAVFIPNSSYEAGEVDEPDGKSIGRLVLPEGILFFNKAKGYTGNDIRSLYKSGRLGSVLGLGEFNKADVAESMAQGSPEAAVTERTPDGVEVKAAAGTQETAPDQLAALEADKTPGNTVQVESPAKVLADRIAARQVAPVASPVAPPAPAPAPAPVEAQAPAPAPAPAPAAPSAAARANAELDAAQAKAQTIRENAIRALAPQIEALGMTVDQALALPRGEQQKIIERAKKPKAAPEKAQAVKDVSKTREEPVTPVGNTAPLAEAAPAEEPKKPGKTQVFITDEATQAATKAYNDEIAARAAETNKPTTEEKVEARTGRVDAVKKQIGTKTYTSAGEEAEARGRAGGARRGKPFWAKVREDAETAADLLKRVPDELVPVSSVDGKVKLISRLEGIINEATERGFVFKGKSTYDTNTDAVVWLNDAKMMLGKLKANLTNGKVSYAEIEGFLMDEIATKRGDGSLLRERRIAAGNDTKKPSGGAAIENVADTSGDTSPGNEIDDIVNNDPDKEDVAVTTEDLAAQKEKDAPPKALPDTATARDDAEIGARVTANKRSVGSLQSLDESEQYAKQLEKVGMTPREWRELNDEDPERAKQIMDKAKADSVKTISANSLSEEEKAAMVARLMGARSSRAIDTDEETDSSPSGADVAGAMASMDASDIDTFILTDIDEMIAEKAFINALVTKNKILSPREAKLQQTLARELSKAINKVAGETGVYVLSDEAFNSMAPSSTMGFYLKEVDAIFVRRSAMTDRNVLAHIMLHEGSHAAFEAAIEASPTLKAQLETLRVKVEQHAVDTNYDGSKYAFKDVHEFLAEAWSNPQFQEFLANTPLSMKERADLGLKGPQTISVKSAILWLKNAVANVLNIKEAFTSAGYPAGTKSTMDAVLDIAGRLLEAAPQARADMEAAVAAGLEDGGSRPMTTDATPKNPGLVNKLKARGLNARQAGKVASIIRKEFGGKATDAQLDEIAALIREETNAAAEMVKAAKAQGAKVKEQSRKLNEDALEAAVKDFTPGKNPGRPWLLGLLTNSQIGRVADRFYGKDNNPVRKIAELIERRRVRRDRYMSDMGSVVEDIVKAQSTHTKEQMEALFSLAHDATMAGAHPDYALDHEMNAHLGKDALSGMFGKGAHSKLMAAYKALPKELKELYVRTRETLTDAQNRMTFGVMRNILNKAGFTDEAMIRRFHEDTATEADFAMVGEELANHLVNAAELKKIRGPYFNLVRRGDHVVRGTYKITPPGNATVLEPNVFEFKDRKAAIAYVQRMAQTDMLKSTIKSVWVDKNTGKTTGVEADGTEVRISPKDVDAENRFIVTVQNEHVEFVDGRKTAKRLSEDLKEAGLTGVSFEKKAWERDAQNAQMLSDQFRSLMATLDKRQATSSLSGAQKAEMRALLNEVSLRFLGSTRIQSSRLPRRYVQGASKDLVRNTYDYVKETSGYLAKLDTEPMIEAELENLEKRHKALVASDTGANEGSRLVMDELKKRALDPNYGDTNGPMARAVDRILRASFVDYLASAGYSVVNSLQPALVTLPVLSGDFNPASASYQLIRAYFDLGTARTVGTGIADTAKAMAGKQADSDFSSAMKSRLTEKRERDMIQELTDVGLIDSDGGLELVRKLDRSSSDVVHYLVDTPLGYLENVVRAMPQAIEAINRGPTALAAYRLMYAKTQDHKKSVQYAKDKVDETQGNYSASNASPVFNSSVGRLLLQFKKYGQMIYTMLGQNVGRVIRRDSSAADRARGVTTLAYVAATQQIVAGSLGLPFLEIPRLIFTGLAAVGFDDMDWEDFEEEVEKFWAEITGSDKAGEMLTYGVTRGIPGGWGFDLNSRVGMDSLMTFGEPRTGKDSDEKSWLFDTFAGPAIATGWDMKNGIEDIFNDKWETGLQKLIPLKTVTDTLKAARGIEGGTMNEQDAVLRVLGLTSARQARLATEKGRDIDAAGEAKDDRNKIIADFVNAATERERQGAWRRAQEYNANLEEGERKLSREYLIRLRTKDRARYQE